MLTGSKKRQLGTSGDAILLMFIKLVTITLGLVVTRLLSEYLSVGDYGTYSQIMLLISTIKTLTILGMIDGTNYFYCRETDSERRQRYLSTMVALQGVLNGAVGIALMLLSKQVCLYFDNPDVKGLLIFAATMPVMSNLLQMVQVLLVAVGKAKMLAVRNLIVSVIRLCAVLVVVNIVQDAAIVLTASLVMDTVQVGLFIAILHKNGCPIIGKADLRMVGTILRYCVPMGIFVAISGLNRDCDKYLISWMTNPETLAVYANASKTLPFDIVMGSFCTVLVPSITRSVTAGNHQKGSKLYRTFLEISYMSTTVLCCAALSAAPQLMELLYSEKYVSGLPVFCIYILVDLLRFTNITMVLTAAGKTGKLMILSVGALAANVLLNIVLFHIMGVPGPAVATLLTTLGVGLLILHYGAKELKTTLSALFDGKFFVLFMAENLILTVALYGAQMALARLGLHYFVILVIICGAYAGIMLALYGKRLIRALKNVNKATE